MPPIRTPEPEAYTDPTAWSITADLPPSHLWPVIRDAYIIPLQTLWYTHGIGLVPSMRSVYRSPQYELGKGRRGTSLHCFPPGSMGAADLTLHDGRHVRHVIDVMIEELPFRRLCMYEDQNFVHVDYGEPGRRSGERRSLWTCTGPGSVWVLRSFLSGPVI